MRLITTQRKVQSILISFASAIGFISTLALIPQVGHSQGTGHGKAMGQMQVIGFYPNGHNKAWTSTMLENGDMLLYGATPLNESVHQSNGKLAINLRNRAEFGSGSSQSHYAQPLLWRADKHAWIKLAAAPECQHNAFLPTATALKDGRILIAGGLCDAPRMAGDDAPRPPFVALSIWNHNKRAWDAAPSLQQARVYHSATLLPNGTVLLAGGMSDPALNKSEQLPVLGSVELFQDNLVMQQASLNRPRARHEATLLTDGSVLLTGGIDAQGKAIADVELWSPQSQSWQRMPPMKEARYAHSASLLADGRILVAGGFADDKTLLSEVEIFDPKRQAWSEGPMLPRALRDHSTLLLPNGDLLLAGGGQFSPEPSRYEWAWLFEASSQQWRPAGRASQSTSAHMAKPDLFLRPDGRVRMLAGSQIQLWQRVGAESDSKVPEWDRDPALAALADGRLAVISVHLTGQGYQTRADIWDPKQNRWTEAGKLNYASGYPTRAIVLPSGKLLHVGLGSNNMMHCEIGELDSKFWQPCGDVQLRMEINRADGLGLASDGRAVFVNAKDEIALFDEMSLSWTLLKPEWNQSELLIGAPIKPKRPLMQVLDPGNGQWLDLSEAAARFWEGRGSQFDSPRMFWDAVKNHWSYIVMNGKIGKHAQALPDGCVISMNPYAVFDPMSGKFRGIVEPPTGLSRGAGQLLVLKDGTVVIVGVPNANTGTGFFFRKASCEGFPVDSSIDDEVMPNRFYDANAEAANLAQLKELAVAKSAAKSSETQSKMSTGRRLFLLVAGLIITYIIWLFWLRKFFRQREDREDSAPKTALKIGMLFLLIAGAWNPWIAPTLKLPTTDIGDCLANSNACLDKQRNGGLIKSVSQLESLSSDNRVNRPHLPCDMIGVWSTIQRRSMFRITLNDDGSYVMDPNLAQEGDAKGYRGHWMVQSRHMVWRHDSMNTPDLDINPILSHDATSFVLNEADGRQTRFELTRKIESNNCATIGTN
ncbi:Kelch repeat-containing protein [Undibacterium curvum]|uniref:Kelch repeat-containing protein n=1 Tax=Undibacterium curvum TaxID=2762294 RepID=UPI003D0F1A84